MKILTELKNCPLCGSKTRWCGEGNPDPKDDHLCDHILCTNPECGADFSFNPNVDVLPPDSDDMSAEEMMDAFKQYSLERFNKRA